MCVFTSLLAFALYASTMLSETSTPTHCPTWFWNALMLNKRSGEQMAISLIHFT